MMNFTLSSPAIYPSGTSVSAYPVSNWPGSYVRTDADPPGSATATATADGSGVAFTGLTADTRYMAFATVGGVRRYIEFFTATPPATAGSVAPTVDTHAARLAAPHVANRFWKETDTGLVFLDDGTNWIIWEGFGRVIKAADETVNNSATLQNDDHLFFPIEVGETWYCEALLLALGASINADYKFGFTGPTGATSQWGSQGSLVVSGFSNVGTTTDPGRSLTFADSVALGARAAISILTLGGWFTADATHAGNIQLQWAQNTATVEDNKILKNSFLRLRRLA
jgi:hypothetical protein